MEANRQKKYYGTSYIDGNTARQFSTAPDIRRERERETEERRRQREQETRVPRRKVGIDFVSFLVLSAAIAATLYVCVDFLQVQSDLTVMEKQIVSLEKQAKDLTNQNDAYYADLQTTYDLNYVYEVAVGELGMVFPNENETVKYQSEKQDYVIQYQDVPEVDENPLDKLLK